MKSLVPLGVAVVALGSLARAQAPATYCTSGTSSGGCTPSIAASGQPNVTHSAGCVLTTTGVDGNRLGLTFYGLDNSGFTPTPWALGSTSLQCVRIPVQRIGGPVSSGGTHWQCDGAFVVDWDGYHASHPNALGTPWAAGQPIYAQSWYRDPLAPKGGTLSNAVELVMRATPALPCSTPIFGMVRIPAGSFEMGSSAANVAPYWEYGAGQPAHQVTLTQCFWMGAKEVTQAEYAALMGSNPSHFVGATLPVENVTWFEAVAYADALTVAQTALGLVPPGYEFRLPTEAEWEYACRAGTTTEFHTGTGLACSDANCSDSLHSGLSCGSTGTLPVGSFAPNAWGLFDMHGNVAEWCLDSYDNYTAAPQVDPHVTGTFLGAVVRGGAFHVPSSACRSASRSGLPTMEYFENLGFRVVLAPALP